MCGSFLYEERIHHEQDSAEITSHRIRPMQRLEGTVTELELWPGNKYLPKLTGRFLFKELNKISRNQTVW